MLNIAKILAGFKVLMKRPKPADMDSRSVKEVPQVNVEVEVPLLEGLWQPVVEGSPLTCARHGHCWHITSREPVCETSDNFWSCKRCGLMSRWRAPLNSTWDKRWFSGMTLNPSDNDTSIAVDYQRCI